MICYDFCQKLIGRKCRSRGNSRACASLPSAAQSPEPNKRDRGYFRAAAPSTLGGVCRLRGHLASTVAVAVTEAQVRKHDTSSLKVLNDVDLKRRINRYLVLKWSHKNDIMLVGKARRHVEHMGGRQQLCLGCRCLTMTPDSKVAGLHPVLSAKRGIGFVRVAALQPSIDSLPKRKSSQSNTRKPAR